MLRSSSAIVYRLIFSVCPTERGHNGPVLEVRRSCHQGMKTGTGEVLMDAKHVGFFPTGRGYDRYPQRGWYFQAQFYRHPSENWKTTMVAS